MNNEETLSAIADNKQFRKDLDEVLQRLKKSCDHTDMPSRGISRTVGSRSSREREIAVQKIQEAIMWLGMDLKAINEAEPGLCPSPYPHSKDPSSPVIEPTSDGLKL